MSAPRSDTESAVHQRFDALCKIVLARGSGIRLTELGDAYALAEEETEGRPDSPRATTCRKRLGLTDAAAAPETETLELPLGAVR